MLQYEIHSDPPNYVSLEYEAVIQGCQKLIDFFSEDPVTSEKLRPDWFKGVIKGGTNDDTSEEWTLFQK